MRLTKIRLAGFKSFVDPTTVPLPSNLVGVVGPNGCGKSNIIDAVRWVMGESSAKHLRGDSMTDVIFTGSSARKPVGQASIELVFDNGDGALGGQYAQYSEIAVRRLVSRDGQSQYFLNGARCRRRDITDVFLGTGLGPRSYAIIEQGMISRVIEAKPEELRSYFEEAAGISLYKERRRETERRMRDTRDNLTRLSDLREEVGAQLGKLKRQAEAAERYKEFKVEERRLRAELLALKYHALNEALQAVGHELAERATLLEAEIARQREAEREMETLRAAHAEGSDALNEIQGRFYALGSDIARIEQQIHHRRELREKQSHELTRSRDAAQELLDGITQDREKLEVIASRLAELEPAMEDARRGEMEAGERVAAAQEMLDEWQDGWEAFNRSAAEPVRIAQVERARIEQLERRNAEAQRRQSRLASERDGIHPEGLRRELETLRTDLDEAEVREGAIRERASVLSERLEELREQTDQLADELNECRGELQHDKARIGSLEVLQNAALGKEDASAETWLRGQGWASESRLAERLSVASGWERAVEVVLDEMLQSVCAGPLPVAEEALRAFEQGNLMLVDGGGGSASMPASGPAGTDQPRRLIEVLSGPSVLADLLAGVFCADTYEHALTVRESLLPGESVITRDGVWVGRGWLRHKVGGQDAVGILAREREIQELGEMVAAAEQRADSLARSLAELQEQLASADEERDELQVDLAEVQRRQAGLQAQLQHKEGRLRDLEKRRRQIVEEHAELGELIQQGELEIREARARLQSALERGEQLSGERDRALVEKNELQARLADARDQLREDRERRHGLALKSESAQAAKASLEEAIARMQSQYERAEERRRELETALGSMPEPQAELGQERESLLQRRLAVEEELRSARARLGEIDARLREVDSIRAAADSRAQEVRAEMEGGRLREQELKVRRQTLEEQLAALEHTAEAVLEAIDPGAREDDWQRRLERVESRIQRLGPINLAAIEEYQTLAERNAYLESQNADLTEALETLEAAIRRIDRETRLRFKETFDRVDAQMQRMFPRLFGGGHAHLELTGEDLLETGVAIMARPPGKRVSNIHLLSGGEKALTAVALVFSIFELNPAPFCMLDEVDAPLDEANVGRFCGLLLEMSKRVQFIFITHNKATMEIATHLTGVTMNEPGVSRLVAVDVDEAVQLATA